MKLSNRIGSLSSGSMSPRSPRRPTQSTENQLEQQINQLVGELRVLEAYFQEIEIRRQTASAALLDTRAASEALGAMSATSDNELLVPIGGGLLLPVNSGPVKKFVVNIGAGAAVEKSPDSAKIFLQSREKELEKAVTTLEQQRTEVSSRLEAGRAALQQISQRQQQQQSQ
jgi:prefoldin alpha subunit